MRRLSLLSFFLILLSLPIVAQVGCPGCQIDLPTLSEDTIFNTDLPSGTKGSPYDANLSFRLPLTTTPVAAYDSTIPPNIPINSFTITSIDSMPAGLKWEANMLEFDPNTQKEGCIRFCGTPTDTGSFELIVRLDVSVFIVTREATFRVPLRIEPAVVTNDGFSMTNPEGCAPLTVGFTNNHPSDTNGMYTYAWDFGDGTTFDGESPNSHTFTEPGQYLIDYQALVDTVGFSLTEVKLFDVDCVDLLGLGNPDVFIILKDDMGTELYNSGDPVNNIDLPYSFLLDIPLMEAAEYTLEVWDDDSGLAGSDDQCGTVLFSTMSTDTFDTDGLSMLLDIQHPITEVLSQDTVTVYTNPAQPTILANTATEVCEGEEVFLLSSSTTSNQWLLDGQPILGATDFAFAPSESGLYQVQVTTNKGCTAVSDSTVVTFWPLPTTTPFQNANNVLYLPDSANLSPTVSLQWFLDGMPLTGQTGTEFCALESGLYSIQLTDTQSGCTNTYSSTILIDPNFDCTSSADDFALASFTLYPNPFTSELRVRLPLVSSSGRLILRNTLGQIVVSQPLMVGQTDYVFPTGDSMAAGVYVFELELDNGASVRRMVVKGR